MRFAILTALTLCLAGPAAAFEEEGLPETVSSTDTAKGVEEEDDQPLIQENDEDLVAFVTDYIRKDIQLKGAFLMEDKASKKIFRLELAGVEPKASGGETGPRTVKANFKDAARKKFSILFHLQNGPWGGLDIFRLELKASPAKPAPGGKKGV